MKCATYLIILSDGDWSVKASIHLGSVGHIKLDIVALLIATTHWFQGHVEKMQISGLITCIIQSTKCHSVILAVEDIHLSSMEVKAVKSDKL